MSQKLSAPQVLIVGGGLVGALLAVLLGRRGLQVSVFEKRPDMRRVQMSAGRSINLALAHRGIAALEQAELFDDVQPLLIPMPGRMLHPKEGTPEFSPYGQRESEVIYSVSRGELNKVMLRQADCADNVTFHFQEEAIAVDLERRRVTFRHTETQATRDFEYDILLGTDGANSVVRDAVVQSAGGTWRTDWLDHDYKELEIPAGPADQYQIEPHALHIWPRHGYMLIALPNLRGSFTVTLFLMKTGNPSFAALSTTEAVRDFFQDQFPDAKALIPDLEEDFFRNPTGVLGTVRCSHWTNGVNATLLGDAAHAIVPFHGQGMNAGFEDAAELARLWDQFPNEWSEILPRFELARKVNGDAIADMALENYVTMRDSVLDPRFQAKKELGFLLERRHPNRFIPRYSMVMFHKIPYSVAQHRGALQELLLDELLGPELNVRGIDWSRADELIATRLSPIEL